MCSFMYPCSNGPCAAIHPLQNQNKVDQDRFDQMSDQYSKMAEDFDRRRDTYQQEHQKGGVVDWQKEVEMERNMKLVADMQTALQREIR